MEKKLTRRNFLKLSGAAAASAAVASSPLFTTACRLSSEKVKVGYLPITDAAPLLTAHAKGFFTDEGLEQAPPTLIRGWSGLIEAFLSGKVNVVHFLLPIPIWMRYQTGAKVKVIAWDHTNGSAITVPGASGITSIDQLRGRQIAVPFWYSMHNVILQMALKKFGITPVIGKQKPSQNETNLLILPPPEMPVAMQGGKIDGYIVAEPFNALGEEKINANILRFTGDIWKNHPCCVIVVKEDLVQSRPEFVQKVTNGIVRAQHWLLNNRLAAATLLSEKGSGLLPVAEPVLKRVFTGYETERYGKKPPIAIQHPEWGLERIGFQPYPYPSATRFIFQNMRQTLVEGNNSFLQQNNPDFIAGDLTDDTFVKKALLEGAGLTRFPEIDITNPWEREEVISI